MTRTDFLGLSKRDPKDKHSLAEDNNNLNKIDLFAQTIATGIAGIPTKETGKVVALTDASDMKLKNLVIYGNTTQNGTPTPEAPVDLDSVENPTVTINGKNLLKNNATTKTVNGVTFTINADGTVTANGTASENATASIRTCESITLPIGTYILSGCPSGGGSTTYDIRYSASGGRDTGSGTVINVTEPTEIYVAILIRSGVTVDNIIFKPMIRLASITDSTYEPYKSQIISVPYTLNGVGDVRDYVDFEKSVLVKKTETYQLTSAMTWAKNSANTRIYTILPDGIEKATNSNIYCTHATKGSWVNSTSGTVCLGNSVTPVCGFATSDFATVDELKSWLDSQTDGVFIVVPLITPTETPLTAEELEAFKALHSYYPTTTITNSENAEMGVEYFADTKIYIDNKFAELNRAILNNI